MVLSFLFVLVFVHHAMVAMIYGSL